MEKISNEGAFTRSEKSSNIESCKAVLAPVSERHGRRVRLVIRIQRGREAEVSEVLAESRFNPLADEGGVSTKLRGMFWTRRRVSY